MTEKGQTAGEDAPVTGGELKRNATREEALAFGKSLRSRAGRSEAGHELDIEVATPRLEADVPSALENLRMGFVPVPAFDPDHPSTSFKVRGKQLRVDLLTPGSDREQAPVYIPRFRAAAAPIKHLSLVLQQPVPAAAVNGGAVLVAVPQPAAFALHKLLVSQTRSMVQQT
jgi:hypothetical protein